MMRPATPKELPLADIDPAFSEMRHRVDPKLYVAVMPVIRERYPDASTKEIDAATVEACLWADPRTRLVVQDAMRELDDIKRSSRFSDAAPAETYANWRLRHDIDDAMKDLPDDFTEVPGR
jgi:hypothetical protein